MDGEEGPWEGRLCEEIGRERVDVRVVQKHPSRRGKHTRLGTSIGGGDGGSMSTMGRRKGGSGWGWEGEHWTPGGEGRGCYGLGGIEWGPESGWTCTGVGGSPEAPEVTGKRPPGKKPK